MSFSTLQLSGCRTLIKGVDVFGETGQQVVCNREWTDVNGSVALDNAKEQFDAQVAAFYAPLTEATDTLEDAQEQALAGLREDPAFFVVLSEAVEGVQAEQAEVVHLSHDSVLLRLIEQGEGDRLIWVNGELEILNPDAVVPGTEVADEESPF